MNMSVEILRLPKRLNKKSNPITTNHIIYTVNRIPIKFHKQKETKPIEKVNFITN